MTSLNGPIRFLNTRFIILDRYPPGTVMNLPLHFPVLFEITNNE